MKNSQYLLGLIAEYQNIYDSEDAHVSSLLTHQINDGQNLFDRKNFTGHITCSGLVLNQSLDSILLVNHRFLQMWLQPGGHVENSAELYKEAEREITEETALKAFQLHPWHDKTKLTDVPFSIDSHDIPASPKKQEDAHVHHDFTYLFVGDSNKTIVRQDEEVSGAEWFTLKDAANLKTDIGKYLARIEKFIL